MTDEEPEVKAEPKTFTEQEVANIIFAERKRERRVSTLLECLRLAKGAGLERGYQDEIAQIIEEIAGVRMLSEITGIQIPVAKPQPEKKPDE